MNEYGAKMERGRVTGINAKGAVIESIDRPGVVTPGLKRADGSVPSVGESVWFWMADDGSGLIDGGVAWADVTGKPFNASGVLLPENGGTGQTSLWSGLKAMTDAASEASSAPVDNDWYLAQVANGGSDTTPVRRKVSALWEYIRGKMSNVAGVNVSGNAGSASKIQRLNVMNGNTSNTYVWIAKIVIPGTNLACAEFDAVLSNREVLENNSFYLHVAIRRNSADSISASFKYVPLDSNNPRTLYLKSDDGREFYVYIASTANSWTTYYSLLPINTQGDVTFYNTGVTSLPAGVKLNITATRGGTFNERPANALTNLSSEVAENGMTLVKTGNIATFSGYIGCRNNKLTADSYFGTIPDGFRPLVQTRILGHGNTSAKCYSFVVDTDGRIKVNGISVSEYYVVISGTWAIA